MLSGTSGLDMVGLYIHIPYCHTRCYYCDFYSRAHGKETDMTLYVDRLIEEIVERVGHKRLRTVYIGGGTPSLLPKYLTEKILNSIDTTECQEITIEVNPEDITDEYAQFLASTPINRVSMGVQSLIDSELKAVGRRHTSMDANKAYELLRKVGIKNISLDLIYGLPGQTLDSWKKSLTEILHWRPEHLSTYLLSYEEGTALYVRRERGLVTEATAELCENYYNLMCEETRRAGYNHYEISNLCLPGFFSRHNSSYWDGTPYIGVGPGAHSFDGLRREYNKSTLKDYLKEGYKSTLITEEESKDEMFNDTLITRLRTSNGLDIEYISSAFGEEYADRLLCDAMPAIKAGYLLHIDNSLIIPEHHWLITDAILVDIIR